MNVQECLKVVFFDNEQRKQLTIPDNFQEEYEVYAKQREECIGLSARASNKRNFILENAERIYPEHFAFLRKYVQGMYQDGYGLKLIGKDLGIGYSRVRTLFRILKLDFKRGRNVVHEKTREIRSDNLKELYRERKGWFKDLERRTNQTQRGVQGYFYNTTRNKYVWLRSTYEYVYARWLNSNDIEWDVEQQVFELEGTTYRPDFFIYESGQLKRIVEVKGYWANREYKTHVLSEKLSIDVVLIKDIKPYLIERYPKELKEWKKIRLSEQELRKLQ